MTPHDHTPIPRVQHRKGFAWLPLEQQLSVFALLAVLLLAVLPLLIDTGRAGGGQLKPALRKPGSMAGAVTRIERHVGLTWWTAGSAGEQRLRQKLFLVAGGLVLAGAAASAKAQAGTTTTTTTTTTTPRTYGNVSAIRARSASTPPEDTHVQ